jgi:hypothetical protein
MFKRRAFFSLPVLGFLPAFLRGAEPSAAENPKNLPVLTEVTNVDELMGDTPWTESPPEYRMKGAIRGGLTDKEAYAEVFLHGEECRVLRVWMPPTFKARCRNDYYGEVLLIQLRTVDISNLEIHNHGSHIRETENSTPLGPRTIRFIDNKPEFEPYHDDL